MFGYSATHIIPYSNTVNFIVQTDNSVNVAVSYKCSPPSYNSAPAIPANQEHKHQSQTNNNATIVLSSPPLVPSLSRLFHPPSVMIHRAITVYTRDINAIVLFDMLHCSAYIRCMTFIIVRSHPNPHALGNHREKISDSPCTIAIQRGVFLAVSSLVLICLT